VQSQHASKLSAVGNGNVIAVFSSVEIVAKIASEYNLWKPNAEEHLNDNERDRFMTSKTPTPATPRADRETEADAEGTRQPMTPEFATYLRELPRLLAAGQAHRYALLKGDTVVAVCDTQSAVLRAGYERFGAEPFAVKKIDPRDPERWAYLQAQKDGHA
jgi:hypothetical protein